MVVGDKLTFGELLMDFRDKKTPLIDLEFPPPALTDASYTFRKPMVITKVTDRYRSSLTYKAIAQDMQRGIQVRSRELRQLNREHTKQRKALVQRYWEKAGQVNDLTVKITAGHVRRDNVRELRLEVETAQEIGRLLPKNMQKHIRHGSLPPLIDMNTAKNLLTHSEHKALPLTSFVGSYYDPAKRTKLTGWDRLQKRIQGVQTKGGA
ncbi:hypothetical protein RvY_02677 [Ramazzottius varieornatus]|uniref:Uncharacterized protein n=1 Tax=Ramazzottius varieornatus TaxID=947166 RepID=A0A1D1UKK1_RAMVA|nr:hypothetical protein RvY_02677 [Ramazzottius varieornatus]